MDNDNGRTRIGNTVASIDHDCIEDESGLCELCGVEMTEACPCCERTGYHAEGCIFVAELACV